LSREKTHDKIIGMEGLAAMKRETLGRFHPSTLEIGTGGRLLDWLNWSGSVASLVGLVVSLYTLRKVTNLPAALRRHSRERQLIELIEKVMRLPMTKVAITESSVADVNSIIYIIKMYYASEGSRKKPLKQLLEDLERETNGAKSRQVIQNQLRLIRDEITLG
jgi:hypothetical protein